MTDTYNDSTGSRKKFLIPLVVLLLCAVSLTGAGYAYNSTVTVEDNTVDPDEFVLEVYNKSGALVSEPMTMANMLVLQHATTIATDNTVVVSAEAQTATYVGKLTVNVENSGNYQVTAKIDDAVSKTYTINGSQLTTVGAGEIVYTLAVKLYVDDNGAKGADEYTGNLNADTTLWYEITVTVSTTENENAITFNNETAQTDVDAVQAKILAQTFNLVFEAQSVA